MSNEIVFVSLDEVVRGDNHREVFDHEELVKLAETINRNGLLQPVVLRPWNGKFQIVAGERRTRAHGILFEKVTAGEWEIGPQVKFGKIAAMVREMTDDEAEEVMALENLQRVNLNPMEESSAYARWLKSGKTVSQMADRAGKEEGHIRKMLMLQQLVPEAKDLMMKGVLEYRYAILMVFPDYVHVALDDNRQRMVLKLLAKVPGIPMVNYKKYIQDLLNAQSAETENVFAFWSQLAEPELTESFVSWGPKARFPFEVREDGFPRPQYVQNDTTGDVIHRYIGILLDKGYEAEAGAVATLYERLVKWHFCRLPKPTALKS